MHDVFGADDRLYMGILGLILILQLVFLVIRYFLLQTVVFFSNEDIHEAMIHGLVRTPSSYFDVTPSGQLSNKFSNDLGILDSTLAFTLIDVIEGPIMTIVMLLNVFTIDLFFLIPGCINVIFLIFFFLYCKEAIIKSKELDLRAKTPVYSTVGEAISGLIQLRIFKRRKSLLR